MLKTQLTIGFCWVFLLLYLIRISDIYKMDIQVENVILNAENMINNWFLLWFFASIFNQNF